MADKIPEDVAYTITTGYYPEIASSVKYKKGKGRGATGRKFKSKRGFSDTSIAKARTRGMTNMQKAMAVGGVNEGPLAGMNLFKKMNMRRDPSQTYYKFTGGSDQYKLYGDQVWYMHGVRNEDALTNYLKDTWGDKHPQFGQIYSRVEGTLIKEGKGLAEEVFNIALKEVEKELQGADGVDVAEEIGFKDGDFEYMSHTAAMQKYPQLAGQLQKQQQSLANPRDMVIIKNGQIVGTKDVTEMPIDKIGQHGITNVPPSLKKAIKEIKDGGGNMEKLRQGVIKMFTSAITKDYNPVIRDIKAAAEIGGVSGRGKMGGKGYKDVLKGLGRAVGKPDNAVSTITIGNVLGLKMKEIGYHSTHEEVARKTSIEYVAHMLGTLNLDTNSTFSQSHRVLDFPNGQSVYANVPMVTNPDTLLFETNPVQDTEILTGYSATLASAEKAGYMTSTSAKEVSKSQKHAFSMTKVTGTTASSTGRGLATANLGITKSARPATVVTIPASDELEKALIEDIQNNIPDISKRLGAKASKLQRRMYGLGKNRRKMKKGTDPNKTQFWALPYIGVLGSDYIKK